jgi:hypothetical protein
MIDLLVLTCLDQLLLIIQTLFTFYNTSYLNEEVNCTEPFLLVSVPWFATCTNDDQNFVAAKKSFLSSC